MNFSQIRRFGQSHAWILLLPAAAVLFIPVNTIGFELPKLLVFAVLAMVSFGAHSADAVRRMPGRGFFHLFLAGIFLSTVFSVVPIISLVGAPPRHLGALAWAVFLLLFLEAASLAAQWKYRAAIVHAMLLANSLVVFEGLLQVLHADPFAAVFASDVFLGRVFSTTGQPDTLAMFILLTLPFVGWWCFSEGRSPVARSAGAALFAANLLTLAATASRSGLLGLGLIALLSVPCIFRWFRNLKGHGSWAVIVAAVLFLIVAGAQGVATMRERFSHPLEHGRSVGSRTIIWPAVARMIVARPIGYGPDTMALVSPRFIGKEIYRYESFTSTVDRAHDLALDLFLAFGPLGLLGFAGFAFALLRAARRGADDPDGFLFPCTLAFAGFFTATLFGFPAALPWAVFWIIAGIIAGITASSREASGDIVPAKLLAWTLLFCVVLEAGICISEIRGRLLLMRGQESFTDHLDAGANLILKASSAAPLDPEVVTRAAESQLRRIDELPENDPLRATLLANAATLVAHLQSITSGNDGIGFALLGWLRAEHHDMKGAVDAIREARRLLPASPIERRVAAQAFAVFGDGESEVKERESIGELLPPVFFDQASELHRIYLKENPWLSEFDK